MVATLVVVTLVLVWAGEDVFAADDETVGGVVEAPSDTVGLVVATVLGLEFEGLACTVVTVVAVVAAVGLGVEVGFEAVAELVAVAETFWVAAGADITVAGVDVVDERGKFFTAVVPVGTGFTVVVVSAGVTLTVSDFTLEAVAVVAGTDAGTSVGEDKAVDGVVAADVATVVVLAGSGPVVFTFTETEGFGSTGAVEAVETTSVDLAAGRVDVMVLAGVSGVVVVGVAVTGMAAGVESATEDEEETWVDAVSRL